MPAAGDRVVFEGAKVGGARREGRLLEVSGRSVRVQWVDGTESLMFPGPGAMRVVGSAAGAGAKPKKVKPKNAKSKNVKSKKSKPARSKAVPAGKGSKKKKR